MWYEWAKRFSKLCIVVLLSWEKISYTVTGKIKHETYRSKNPEKDLRIFTANKLNFVFFLTLGLDASTFQGECSVITCNRARDRVLICGNCIYKLKRIYQNQGFMMTIIDPCLNLHEFFYCHRVPVDAWNLQCKAKQRLVEAIFKLFYFSFLWFH